MKILKLLYKCNINSIYLYVEEGKLKYKQTEIIDENLKFQLLELIKKHKNELISVLLDNHVTSFNLIKYPIIYRARSVNAPLSFAQERLWFIERYEEVPMRIMYRWYFRLSISINLDILKKD